MPPFVNASGERAHYSIGVLISLSWVDPAHYVRMGQATSGQGRGPKGQSARPKGVGLLGKGQPAPRVVNIAILKVLQYYRKILYEVSPRYCQYFFQKSIGNGIANTFVPKILPIIFGNNLTFLDAMVIVHCSVFAKYYFTPLRNLRPNNTTY